MLPNEINRIVWYRNIGSDIAWNGDGQPDLVGAMERGLYPFVCHTGIALY